MDCKNQNIEELLRKAKKYDELENIKQGTIKYLKELEDFFNALTVDSVGLVNEFGSDYYYAWPLQIKKAVELLLDKEYQSRQLANERKRYQKEYLEQISSLEKEKEYLGQQLTEAWEKFRAIKTRRFQQTLREIDDENLELEKRAKIPAYRKIKERMEKLEENEKEV
jgi:hypothetical protein